MENKATWYKGRGLGGEEGPRKKSSVNDAVTTQRRAGNVAHGSRATHCVNEQVAGFEMDVVVVGSGADGMKQEERYAQVILIVVSVVCRGVRDCCCETFVALLLGGRNVGQGVKQLGVGECLSISVLTNKSERRLWTGRDRAGCITGEFNFYHLRRVWCTRVPLWTADNKTV